VVQQCERKEKLYKCVRKLKNSFFSQRNGLKVLLKITHTTRMPVIIQSKKSFSISNPMIDFNEIDVKIGRTDKQIFV